MGATTTAAVVAGSSAATSARIARERQDCREYLSSFNAQIATPGEQVTYARCVDRLVPQERSEFPQEAAIALCVAIAIGAAIGGYLESRDSYGTPLVGVFFGAIMGPLGLLLLCGLAWLVLRAFGAV